MKANANDVVALARLGYTSRATQLDPTLRKAGSSFSIENEWEVIAESAKMKYSVTSCCTSSTSSVT